MNYYKVLREDLNHNGFQYKENALNVDTEEFNPHGSCESGGLYFSRKDILAFLNYGPWICKVTLPKDARIHKDTNSHPEKWKADKIILGRKFKLTEKKIQQLKDEGADVHALGDQSLKWSSIHGHLEIVKLLFEHGANVQAFEDEALGWASKWASQRGHFEVVKVIEEHIAKGKK